MKNIEEQVKKILLRVKKDGDRAVCFYIKKFDKRSLNPAQLRIAKEKCKAAYQSLNGNLKNALNRASRNIKFFYRKEKNTVIRNWSLRTKEKIVGQRFVHLDSVGVYVPGGKFSYPSTVLMTAIPARIAGVKRVVMISPPGKISKEVLAAAWIAEVDEVYQVGGPAGIAALAYGTKTIAAVDKIIGPGNAYVTAAKKFVFGKVGIDMLAGPSEIAVVADNERDAEMIVQDLKAQKEHDADAAAYLISLNSKLTSLVKKMYGSVAIKQVNTIQQAAAEINRIAPEHVELLTRNNDALLKRITSAGTVCVGRKTPVAIGDYAAGPSHVLPTGRTARFSSGLSITDFYKKINIIRYTAYSTDLVSGICMADAEGMIEHKASLQRRVQYGKKKR